MNKIYADVNVEELETSEEPVHNKIRESSVESRQVEIKKEVMSEEEQTATTEPIIEGNEGGSSSSKQRDNTEPKNQKVESSDEKRSKEPSKNINPANLDNYELFWRDIASDEIDNSYRAQSNNEACGQQYAPIT